MTDPINKIFLILGEIQGDQKAMKEDIIDIKDGVSDYKKTKNRLIGMGLCISAIVGGSVSSILNKLGIDT